VTGGKRMRKRTRMMMRDMIKKKRGRTRTKKIFFILFVEEKKRTLVILSRRSFLNRSSGAICFTKRGEVHKQKSEFLLNFAVAQKGIVVTILYKKIFLYNYNEKKTHKFLTSSIKNCQKFLFKKIFLMEQQHQLIYKPIPIKIEGIFNKYFNNEKKNDEDEEQLNSKLLLTQQLNSINTTRRMSAPATLFPQNLQFLQEQSQTIKV